MSEPFGTRWGRRLATFAAWALGFVGWSALLVPSLPLALIVDGVRRSRLAVVRSLLMVEVYLACELAGLVAAGVLWLRRGDRERFLDGNFRLQWWWASCLFGAARRLFALRVEVEGGGAVTPGPILVLVRHASVADTLLPVALVSSPFRVRLRYVLKRELLWDPCLDVVGNRLPNAFVRRGSTDPVREVATVQALAEGLGERDGVLLFPEGTRATPRKRASAIERLISGHAPPELVERARRLQHVMPPRLGGALALLDGAARADVVFLAHAGFEGVRSLADLFNGKLVGQRVRVLLWRCPRASIPVEREARARWLFDEWQRMDDWVATSP